MIEKNLSLFDWSHGIRLVQRSFQCQELRGAYAGEYPPTVSRKLLVFIGIQIT